MSQPERVIGQRAEGLQPVPFGTQSLPAYPAWGSRLQAFCTSERYWVR